MRKSLLLRFLPVLLLLGLAAEIASIIWIGQVFGVIATLGLLLAAGFAGIALLQEQRNWRGAANLADRLGLTEGSRAVEAAELAKRIRLQHFLWGDATDPPP